VTGTAALDEFHEQRHRLFGIAYRTPQPRRPGSKAVSQPPTRAFGRNAT
jgi:hypothetical protein